MIDSALIRARVEAGHRWRFAERSRFANRSRGARMLVLVLGGHKPTLWPWTLPRLAADAPADADVCLVSPGVDRPELSVWAAQHGWSYLTTRGGHVSVAQNLAIQAHPEAYAIVKIDEDVFVAPGFFTALVDGHRRVVTAADFRIGFSAPTLNVNGFSYLDVLRVLGLEEAYRDRFGPARRASDGIPAHTDGDAAVWLWSHGLPVDEMAKRFASRPFGYSIVPHRFSIGAILYERELWEDMRGFKRLQRAPGLGEDEQHICVTCLSLSRVMVVLDQVYAGHFAFGPQQAAMEAAFGQRLSEF